MKDLHYNCMKCGICCFEIEGPETKRIPLYPEEVNRLIEKAKEKNLNFNVIEDLVFPDILNHKIIVLTYKIILSSNGHCPFYDKNKGCTIQDTKPLACSTYPLALRQIDAFNFQISIDPLCKWTISNYDSLKNINSEEVKEIFKDEYPKAEKFYRKNKNLMFKIRRLEAEKKIKITRQLSLEIFNKALKEWGREEIIT